MPPLAHTAAQAALNPPPHPPIPPTHPPAHNGCRSPRQGSTRPCRTGCWARSAFARWAHTGEPAAAAVHAVHAVPTSARSAWASACQVTPSPCDPSARQVPCRPTHNHPACAAPSLLRYAGAGATAWGSASVAACLLHCPPASALTRPACCHLMPPTLQALAPLLKGEPSSSYTIITGRLGEPAAAAVTSAAQGLPCCMSLSSPQTVETNRPCMSACHMHNLLNPVLRRRDLRRLFWCWLGVFFRPK